MSNPSEAGLGVPYPIKISKVARYPEQPRRYFDSEGLEALADSISADGQQQPIKVCRDDLPGTFMLIDGERRWRAHHILWERRKVADGAAAVEPTIEAFIQTVKNKHEHFKASVIANLHREDLSPLDEAASLDALRSGGETLGRLADMIGKSTTYVENYLKLHTLPDPVKELMSPARPRDRRLSVTAAIEIARSTRDPALRLEIARESLQRELRITDTRSLIEQRTGAAGQRLGGWDRKPSDDYKVFTTGLGRLGTAFDAYLKLDFARLYTFRDNERSDRAHDLRLIERNLDTLQRVQANVQAAPGGALRDFDLVQLQLIRAQLVALRSSIEATDDSAHRRT